MKPSSNRPPHAPDPGVGVDVMPVWKRGLDLLCCGLGLPFLALGTLAMLAVTALVAPGPIFYRQERVGCRGRRFRIFKFRTMTVGADTGVHRNHVRQLLASNAPMSKLDGGRDARLIPGGGWLRASGMDELPQLFNVLRGEMSFVGPRPCLPGEFDHAPTEVDARFEAVPGLTGLWQVSGKNRTTFLEMIRLDIHYARHVSPLLDLKIILLTPLVLIRQVFEVRAGRTQPQVLLRPEQAMPAGRATPGVSGGPALDGGERDGRVLTSP